MCKLGESGLIVRRAPPNLRKGQIRPSAIASLWGVDYDTVGMA